MNAPHRHQYGKPTTVYVIRAVESGHLKIGRSRRPNSRLADLQTANWERLEVVFTMPAQTCDEHEIHRRLAGYKVRGEWYEPGTPWEATITHVIETAGPFVKVEPSPLRPPAGRCGGTVLDIPLPRTLAVLRGAA